MSFSQNIEFSQFLDFTIDYHHAKRTQKNKKTVER